MAHRVPVSADDSQDPLHRMRVFQLAGELIPDCFVDATLVRAEHITQEIAGQLYWAVCSIESNISEAYSRSSGKDRALRFEYALGSVRESMSLYKSALPVLGEDTVRNRRDRLEEMRRMLLAIIPRERGKTMK
ncbi:MAG: four helix bundle protein [Gemmatimonadaceae bacterium]